MSKEVGSPGYKDTLLVPTPSPKARQFGPLIKPDFTITLNVVIFVEAA